MFVVYGFRIEFLKDLWSDLQSRYPDAQRPSSDETARSLLPSEWPAAMSTCMASFGFQDVTVSADGSLDWEPVDQAFELAEFQYWAVNPLGAHVSDAPR